MSQGLKGAPHTYAQFGDLIFGPLPKNSEGTKRMPTLIGRFKDHAFQIFMDDHSAAARDFLVIWHAAREADEQRLLHKIFTMPKMRHLSFSDIFRGVADYRLLVS